MTKLSKEQVRTLVDYIDARIAAINANHSCGPHVSSIREQAVLAQKVLFKELCK